MSPENTEQWPVYVWPDEDRDGRHYLLVYKLYEQQVYIISDNREDFDLQLQQLQESLLQVMKTLCSQSIAAQN